MNAIKYEDRIKAYKVFNKEWVCSPDKEKPFQYAVGGEYHYDGEVLICKRGFHACKKMSDCFNYRSFDSSNKVAEVEVWGVTDTHEEDSKIVASRIHIVREMSWPEVLDLCNTGTGNTGFSNTGYHNSGNRNSGNRNTGYHNSGNRNSGNRNSGHRNSGYRNSGDCNSGNYNSGDWNSGYRNSGDRNSGNYNSGNHNSGHSNTGFHNSGNWNSGDWNSCGGSSGYFNSDEPKTIRVFNKPCDRKTWEDAIKPDFIHFDLCDWVPSNHMTDDEKNEHPEHETTGGYLKQYTYREAWKRAWETASDHDKRLLYSLPNFDPVVFEEISGIDVTQDNTWNSEAIEQDSESEE
jgi:hypothetical protein